MRIEDTAGLIKRAQDVADALERGDVTVQRVTAPALVRELAHALGNAAMSEQRAQMLEDAIRAYLETRSIVGRSVAERDAVLIASSDRRAELRRLIGDAA